MLVKLYEDNVVEYEYMNDEDIVELAKQGNSSALNYLLSKYRSFVKARSASYFLVGGDRDDIIQEGMIGLYKSIRDYDKARISSFVSFIDICIKRQIITAIKAATRNKHIPLNTCISLNRFIYDEDTDWTLMDIIEDVRALDPIEILISAEELGKMKSEMNRILSGLEYEVIQKFLQGKSYKEISLEINRDLKCVDNALQRVKRKLG